MIRKKMGNKISSAKVQDDGWKIEETRILKGVSTQRRYMEPIVKSNAL